LFQKTIFFKNFLEEKKEEIEEFLEKKTNF
jgi:hypothetical protein